MRMEIGASERTMRSSLSKMQNAPFLDFHSQRSIRYADDARLNVNFTAMRRTVCGRPVPATRLIDWIARHADQYSLIALRALTEKRCSSREVAAECEIFLRLRNTFHAQVSIWMKGTSFFRGLSSAIKISFRANQREREPKKPFAFYCAERVTRSERINPLEAKQARVSDYSQRSIIGESACEMSDRVHLGHAMLS